MSKTACFEKRVEAVRNRFEADLVYGQTDKDLLKEITCLQKEEKQLLAEALPAARQKRLNKENLQVRFSVLCAKPEELEESSLSEQEKNLCRNLLRTEYMDEPDLSFCPEFDASCFSCTFYMEVHNDDTCFVFGDDGTVYLIENNKGWQYRRKPLINDCFGEKAMMESSCSCLILDLDKRIMRLCYDRLNTAEDLFREPYYG